MRRAVLAIAGGAALLCAAPRVEAFCGFYVAGGGAELFNDATQVVMMRKGTRTVLSMQNSYKGPPSDFAMVVPVPVVLKKQNVKTLPAEVFDRVEKLGAPRLVEYWEQDPCYKPPPPEDTAVVESSPVRMEKGRAGDGANHGVTVEAKFAVGEYQVVILSAKKSSGLDTWLREQKYKIPEGAEPYLRPYVESGSKFFVAKVDVEKVKFEGGRAVLSPLRFYYDSNEFSLPIRLGMMNSAGTQDLIVNILSPGQRYEVANYDNVTIPTNLDLKEAAKNRFGEFYAALFDRTLEKHPKAVVTEYAWNAASCDPCPLPALTPSELATLGADVLDGGPNNQDRSSPFSGGFVLTRLHARYAKDGIDNDLVFKQADPIAGGREWRGDDGKLEEGAQKYSSNMFQARYAIRHPWTGKIDCEDPIRGRWGGPPSGVAGSQTPQAATNLASVTRGKVALTNMVAQPVPGLDVSPSANPPASNPAAGSGSGSQGAKPPTTQTKKKKGCQIAGGAGGAAPVLLALVAIAWRRRRRRSAPR